jgi:hypothetical protein
MADIQNMSRLDELPPDQRAALSLLLRQRKSYAELAALLAIPERAVHDRAHAALAVLAPRQARELDPKRREEIGDYLLGQQPGVAERLATRTYLSASAPAQAWASALASELRALADAALPEIPPASLGAPPGASGSAARPTTARAATPRALLTSASAQSSSGSLPSSRLGGALILAAIVAAIVVAAILLSSGGGSHAKTTASSPPATSSSSSSSTSKTTSTTGNPAVRQRLTLHSANVRSRSAAAVDIIAEGSKRAFYIEAQHLAPSKGFFYAIWLYSSPRSFLPLSKSPPVGSNKRLAGGALLPANAATYREMLLTRETSDHPTHPGRVVLRGPFSLGA